MLTESQNFADFPSSLLTLITMMTGEGWYNLMFELDNYKTPYNDCVLKPTYKNYVDAGYKTVGCGYNGSHVFFIVYMFFVSIVLVNLFVAVVL